MSLWMRDMRREDISTRNGRVDGPFLCEKFRYSMDLQCDLAYIGVMSIRHTYFRAAAFLSSTIPYLRRHLRDTGFQVI